MSKAEELAEELIQIIDGPAFHVPHYKVRDVMDELRRLAALEEELNALKSALMDAEPVAVVGSTFQLLWSRQDWSEGLKVGDFLYTLNGIKS